MRSYARFNRGLVRQYQKWMIAMHYVRVTQSMYTKALLQYIDFMGKRSLARAGHADFPVSAFYKGESQQKRFSGDWKEPRCSRCFPAPVEL